MILPDWQPQVEDVLEPDEYLVKPYHTVRPHNQRIGDWNYFDYWRSEDQVWVRRLKWADHPNISLLPPNTPRIVRQLYIKEFQLRLVRSTSYVSDIDKAYYAWDKFVDNL